MHSFLIHAFPHTFLHPSLFLPSLTHTWTCQHCIAENFLAALRHLTLTLPVKDRWGQRDRARQSDWGREREDALMNPLTEQRVHLSGNPIKSQGEMLLCLLLIIVSLPCTAATALFLEVYWDGGGRGSWTGGGKEEGKRKTFSLYTQCSHVALHAPHLLGLFCTSPSSSPSLSFSFSPYVPPSFPSTPLSVPFLIFYS